MNEDTVRIQTTIRQMKELVDVLVAIADELPKDPKSHAARAEAPLEQLDQKRIDVDQLLDQFKPRSLQRANLG
jgi:hypothetical protein